MTELRQRMLDAMVVRGLSVRTQECYVEAVARMARHYHMSPDLLSPAQVVIPPLSTAARSRTVMQPWPIAALG